MNSEGYTLKDDILEIYDLATITGKMFNNNTDIKKVVISGSADIKPKAFAGCPNLTIVTISEGAEKIWPFAFKDCSNLREVFIPESVESIGEEAFQGCSKLASITIPDSVNYIGEYAFCDCSSLTEITIPDEVETIETGTFSYCTNLKDVTLPYNLRKIGGFAFQGCENLKSIEIPVSVQEIEFCAFNGCNITDLESGILKIKNGCALSENGLTVHYRVNRNLSDITIPKGVEKIADNAFIGCSTLTTVTIPEGVHTIGKGAFKDCKNLINVTIPDDIQNIGAEAFIRCCIDHLECRVLKIINGCALSGDGLKLLYRADCLNSDINIPEGVIKIGSNAFSGCENLAAITIPQSVKKIEEGAFGGCKNLKKIIYQGTKEEFESIKDGLKNRLEKAKIIFEKQDPKDVSKNINCLEGLIESIVGDANASLEQRMYKLAEHMVEHSFFFPKEIVDEQHKKMISALKNKEALPARYSEVDECYCYADGTMPKFKNKDEAVKGTKLSKTSDVFFKIVDSIIPVKIDKDGNYYVRQLITETTGHKISQGATSTITYATISHIWGNAFNPIFFTSLWNIVIVPTYCNPILDKDDKSQGDDVFAKEVAYINKVYRKICYEYYDVKSKLEDFKKLGFDITPDVPYDNVDFSIAELPFISKFEKRRVAKSKSQKTIKSAPRKQVVDNNALQNDLQSIGMKAFVKFYKVFANPQYTTADIKSLIRTTCGYTPASSENRASIGRGIINKGLGRKALEIITKARVDEDIRLLAEEYLSLEP